MTSLAHHLDTSAVAPRPGTPRPPADGHRLSSEVSDLDAGEVFACPTAGSRSAALLLVEPDEPTAAACLMPAELIHGIEAVVTPTSPGVRSAAISSVIEEIYRTVEWLHGDAAGQAELTSLTQVLAAARAHEARMAELDARA